MLDQNLTHIQPVGPRLVVNNVVPAYTGKGTSRAHPGLTPAQVRLHHQAIARNAPNSNSFRLFTSAPYAWAVEAKAAFARSFDKDIAEGRKPACACCRRPVMVNGRIGSGVQCVSCTSSYIHQYTGDHVISYHINGAALCCGYCRARGTRHVLEEAAAVIFHPHPHGWSHPNIKLLML